MNIPKLIKQNENFNIQDAMQLPDTTFRQLAKNTKYLKELEIRLKRCQDMMFEEGTFALTDIYSILDTIRGEDL